MDAARHRTALLGGLAAAVPDGLIHGDANTSVGGIRYDSRLVAPGDLFAALVGADADGHAYAAAAVSRGAAALLVEHPLDLGVPQLVVPNSRAALALVAAEFWGHPSREIGVVGITGTDGKTTTSFLVDHLVRSAGLKTGMVGTVAVRVGDEEIVHETRQTTPESADLQAYLRAMVDAGAAWAILEATSHGLAMHRLDGIAFRIGAVTNVTHEHLDFHGSVENYRRAKGILFARVAAHGGTAIVNVDDAGARTMLDYAAGARLLRYGVDGGDADLRAVDVRSDGRGSRFRLETADWGTATIDLPLIGGFNVANALCAAGVALATGLPLPAIADGLATAPPIPGRMVTVDAGQPFSVVVDYAHTPDALEKVLTLLRGLHPDGRLIAVFGSAGERDVAKRPAQGAVAARLADFAVFTTEDPRHEDPDAIIDLIADGA
ncbi:MAG: UDP-N-acetylmuramoyl-L-alanyl-D-glutamate--2,6-diaminopimelate ligase, partial [Chloroflexota bacterium]|nr:UDP-N-acetylmuramoyl-L-alanyl-D-glutamate--2,6-diaminopimelate ligase [Chloroflexota bacterium]